MLTIKLTEDAINYNKLIAYLEENKQIILLDLDDTLIDDVTYSVSCETLIETITYYDKSQIHNEYELLNFDGDKEDKFPISLNELLNRNIINLDAYIYILYDEIYEFDVTNVILKGIVTSFDKAKEHECAIFATVPDKLTELIIYTEIDHDYYNDDDDLWCDYYY